MIWKA